MAPRILIVDDTPEQLAFVCRQARRYLGDTWEILQAESLDSAMRLLDDLRQRGEHLACAVVDAYLSHPRQHKPEGLQILARVKEMEGEGCFKILISKYIRDRSELRADAPVDAFVHLLYENGRGPAGALQEALYEAERHAALPH